MPPWKVSPGINATAFELKEMLVLCPVSALIFSNALFILRSVDAPIGRNLFKVLRSIHALLCGQFILVPQIVAAMIFVSFVASGRGFHARAFLKGAPHLNR